jgi:hypothetical protein
MLEKAFKIMNIIKFLRKPYLAIFLSALFLFTACTQYDSEVPESQSFDYSAFLNFKNGSKNFSMPSKFKSSADKNKAIFDASSKTLGVNVQLPEAVYQLSNYDSEDIYAESLKQGWLSKEDIKLYKTFTSDVESLGLDSAIENFEEVVLKMSLSDVEFNKKNTFLNIIKTVDSNNPSIFQNTFSKYTTWYQCAAASIALTSAVAGTVSCLTVAACGLAFVLVYAASNSFAHNCLDDDGSGSK